jgi:predicted glycogen debranching enzyme
MYLGKADVNTYDKGVEREFLVSNGTGSYGSSTVVGANTRSEHGLLVVHPQNSTKRTVLVSKLEETLYAHNRKYHLSTNRYKDLIYPDGYRYLQEYQGTPFPSMLFVIHSIFLKKSIFMPQSGASTIIKYELLASPSQVRLDIRPLFAHRANNEINGSAERSLFESSTSAEGTVNVRGRGFISHVGFAPADDSGAAKWSGKPLWFDNVVYEKDERQDAQAADSLWSPGIGSLELKKGGAAYVVLSDSPVSCSASDIEELERETVERIKDFVKRVSVVSHYSGVHEMIQSSSHLVADNKGVAPTVFSGFPSVEQRARDTFIALPGLTLATGRTETARGVLDNWLDLATGAGGLMPASIDQSGNPKFGDIDSGLWFLYAADKYATSVGQHYSASNYEKLKSILERYTEGLDALGAVMDSDSKLLKYFNIAETGHWMSGEADGEPLVERRGYLVEVNALWHNALCFMKKIAELVGDAETAARYENFASACRESFEKIFWNDRTQYLFDWVDSTKNDSDDAIRPNAILAVSLPYPALGDERGRQVFATCWDELYTTYGLRTLDPRHEKFKGRAEGRPDQRKKARLRGMAQPWLLGQFITAYMKFNPEASEMGWSFIRPFASHLRRGCLGGVAEYFDGMMPYMPAGDVLSAMSLGELLRVIHEDLEAV